MTGVLLGFGVVAVLTAVGFATAALLPGEARTMRAGLTPVIYYLTNPALMVVLVAGTDLGAVLGVYTPIALAAAAVAGALFALYSGLVLRRGAARTAVGAMASSYVNAGNIGLPIALYAVGSAAPVVSVLLAQLLVIAPLYLLVFSWATRPSRRAGPGAAIRTAAPGRTSTSTGRTIVRSVANPVTVGTAAGVLLSATGLEVPEVLWAPLEMLGQASVPLLLLLFGMGLHGQRPFRNRALVPDVLGGTLVKVVAMPVLAWAIGRFGFGLGGTELLGVVVMAALPTAQNVFLFSSQFRMPANAARDIILLSSFLSFPAVLLAGLLLH
ncbi:AEC family transporter [Kocuria sp. UCD-OTCP]|uniref:AEC family transporter n=1 Tax=Kocuria sp. UCD-OTCP TaxID=1292021 RepID=UPI00036FC406|nr:AEC family transporter [Kocuria sp. UCD-OTCP]EYT54427.1 membrane protein [Kocuria sp. UCD-OTCP]